MYKKQSMIIGGIFAALLLMAGVSALYIESANEEKVSVVPPATLPTPLPTETSTLQYGSVTLRMGETAKFKDNTITLLDIFEDSRCPVGVTCIWAGTLKAKIRSVTGVGTSTEVIELGKFITTEAEMIVLTEASPQPKEGVPTLPTDYKLTFEVTKRSAGVINTTPTTPATNLGACYTGGCSGQVCSDKEGVASNCIFKEEYACYQNATCARQASGVCGWTQTKELEKCLSNF